MFGAALILSPKPGNKANVLHVEMAKQTDTHLQGLLLNNKKE